MMEYEFHQLCMVLPEMPAERFTELVEDIRAKGLVWPITLYEGKILDGRHRYLACIKSGREARFDTYPGDDPVGFVASSCCHRDMTKSQRALVAAGFLGYEREQARKRMSDAGAMGGRAKGPEDLPDPFPNSGDARDKAGAKMGVSGKTVDQAAKVIAKAAEEIVERVKSGDMTLNEAVKVIDLNPQAQKKIAEIADKRERSAEVTKAINRSAACKRRDNPAPEISLPGTPFVRQFLGLIETLSNRLASEFKLKDAADIQARFIEEFDANSPQLQRQLAQCAQVMSAISRIHAKSITDYINAA